MRLPDRRRLYAWLLWITILVLATVGMISVRTHLDQVQIALLYLLVVLGGSAGGGRTLGLFLACSCFLLFDYFLQTPYDTLSVDKPLDWLVLVAFLVTATVATQLLARANAQAEAARLRAEEIDRLASLGAETLSVGSAGDSLTAIARVIRETIGAAACEIHALTAGGRVALVGTSRLEEREAPPDAGLVVWVAENRRPAAERTDGSGTFGREAAALGEAFGEGLAAARALLLPLVAHGRTVGVLRLADSVALELNPARRRFLTAIAYYAALGVERLHLVAEAEHAAALREADRLKDALLASVSHDLRTPLTTIKALAHDLADAGDERAAVIEQQADRLNHLVADLLDLSRLHAGRIPMRAEINAAEDLVGTAIQQVSGALHGRELRTSIAPGPVPVGRFDFVHSLRILVNLIENALKYSPPATPIDIAVTHDGERLAIAVADRGRGVVPSERERIFEAFYRPAGVASDAGGAGLGLAIARRLAEAQGGTLGHTDRAGGGSIFTLHLPAALPLEESGSL